MKHTSGVNFPFVFWRLVGGMVFDFARSENRMQGTKKMEDRKKWSSLMSISCLFPSVLN